MTTSRSWPWNYRWLATAALNATAAWVLLVRPVRTTYATGDGGAAWHRLAIFA
ncbi:MAG: hypothetical protein ABSB52_03360 [Acidimicrobiales bacterium]